MADDADISGRRYYRITLTACGIFMALIYLVRLTLGKLPFKWTCAITDFANFTGRFNNVYLSIAVFGVLLFATVYIAQLGVVKGIHTDIAKKRREREQRIREDEKATIEFRKREAETVDVLGMMGTSKDQLPEAEKESEADIEAAARLRTETRSGIDVLKLGGIAIKTKEDQNEEARRASEELRNNPGEGVDVLGAVTKRKHRSKVDEEILRKSEELRRKPGEDVDVLGAVTKRKHRSQADEELVKRSEELRREKREGVDVLGAVIENNLDPEEKF